MHAARPGVRAEAEAWFPCPEPSRDDCPPVCGERPRKLVERTWYFGCDEDRDDCRPRDPCDPGGNGGHGGGHGGGEDGGRPTRPGGTAATPAAAAMAVGLTPGD